MRELRDPNERRIGPYIVVGTIARGATGEVVKAIDGDLNRTVAIKILSPEFVEDPEALARFEREARAVTQLDHPNIARIYEAGITLEGEPYLVMEYVDGSSLMELIEEKVEFPFSRQLDLVIQAAEGLRAALNRNIIHRDIKPANLMVDRDFVLKIVDFGLAKVIREDAYKSAAGRLLGTPRYMAPEVAMGRPADHRSDIYSLGATFYHLLTGRPPFDGATPAMVMMQHVNSPLIPPYLINPQIPADICEIVERAMAKDPNERYQDYDELIADLKAAKVARLARERTAAAETAAEQEEALGPRAPVSPETPAAAEPTGFAAVAEQAEIGAGGARSPASSYLTSGKVVALGEEEAVRRGPSGRLLALLVVLFIVAAGLAFYTLGGGSQGGGGAGLPGFVQALLARLGSAGSAEGKEIERYKETVERLKFLASAVKEYIIATGHYPRDLRDLRDRKIVTKSDLVDGYGGEILYETATHRIRSPGPDGVAGSGDDFVADEDGRLLEYPPKPETMEEEEFTHVIYEPAEK